MTNMVPINRARHAAATYALLPPEVPAAPAPRYTFQIKQLEDDVLVIVKKTPNMRSTDFIQLQVDGAPVGEDIGLAPIVADPAITEIELVYPKNDFPAVGTDVYRSIDYYVYDRDSEVGSVSGSPVRVRFDQKPPGGDGLPPLTFTGEQFSGITVEDLVEDPNDPSKRVLPVLTKAYFDAGADDQIELWLGTSRTDGKFLEPPFTVTDPRNETPVQFTEQDLLDAGDGTLYFGYRSTDWAGNVAALSALTPLSVYLRLPALPAPVVPEYDDGLITYNDANDPPDHGVVVQIPAYPGVAANDRLVVAWGKQVAGTYIVQTGDVGNDPVAEVVAPYQVVADEGNGNIDVAYQLERTNQPITDSPNTQVVVDLSTPGGPDPDPDPETPEHDNIRRPLITCGASPENTIEPTDYGKDATATIYRGGVDSEAIWEVGDVIQLRWGTLPETTLAPVPVTVGNQPGDIRIPIPFDGVIEVEGVGDIEVWFTITRLLANDVPVTVQSPKQSVKVASAASLPGGGTPLAEGVFPEANANNIITQRAGIDGTTAQIPLSGVANVAAGDFVSYDFVGVQSGDATDPGASPIEQSRKQADDVEITAEMMTAGYLEIDLPYSLTYFICRNGAILDYSIRNLNGTGNARRRFVRFAMNNAAGSCPLP